MITIHLTQCRLHEDFQRCVYCTFFESLPMRERIECYSSWLRTHPNCELFSLDENLILVAQKLRRDREIILVKIVDYCACGAEPKKHESILNDEGDLPDNLYHGFFVQRLALLR